MLYQHFSSAQFSQPANQAYRPHKSRIASAIQEHGGNSAIGAGFLGRVGRSASSVRSRQNLKPIEDIEVGDLVWAWHEGQGTHVKRRVKRLFRHKSKPILEVSYIIRPGTVQNIQATTEHPFWIEEKGWVSAQDLKPGELLKGLECDLGRYVLRVQDNGLKLDVFNFEVDELHNYFVGTEGVLVHNSSDQTGFWPSSPVAIPRDFNPAADVIQPAMARGAEKAVYGYRRDPRVAVFEVHRVQALKGMQHTPADALSILQKEQAIGSYCANNEIPYLPIHEIRIIGDRSFMFAQRLYDMGTTKDITYYLQRGVAIEPSNPEFNIYHSDHRDGFAKLIDVFNANPFGAHDGQVAFGFDRPSTVPGRVPVVAFWDFRGLIFQKGGTLPFDEAVTARAFHSGMTIGPYTKFSEVEYPATDPFTGDVVGYNLNRSSDGRPYPKPVKFPKFWDDEFGQRLPYEWWSFPPGSARVPPSIAHIREILNSAMQLVVQKAELSGIS